MRARHFGFVAAAVVGAVIASAAPRTLAAPDTGRVVTDDVGRAVKMPAEVRRIVSLAPNLTETVFALGLGDRLAGDTDYCDTPAAAKSKPHVGNPQNPSLEAIVALHPDLVLATTSINRVTTADELERLGIAVYTTNGDTQTVLAMLDSIGRMAELIGAGQHGAELLGQMRRRLDALHARLSERPMVHVLFVVWLQPLSTIGQETFIADALRWAGAESVVISDQPWPNLSLEEVVRLQPDYLVFTDDHEGGVSTELADLRSRPVWRDLDAVVMGHVVNVSEEVVRPSPGLVDVIEQLAHELHPEVFSERNEIRSTKSETRMALMPATEIEKECRTCAR